MKWILFIGSAVINAYTVIFAPSDVWRDYWIVSVILMTGFIIIDELE